MICESLTCALGKLGYRNVTPVSNCADLMARLKIGRFTHLITDIVLTDGNTIDIIGNIRRLYPTLRIAFYSAQPPNIDGKMLRDRYGITHYISKRAPSTDFMLQLRTFFEGREPFDDQNAEGNPFSTLAPRELEVTRHLLQGSRNKKIMGMLNVHNSTISKVKKRVFEKTKTANLLELKKLAALYQIFEQ